ncbi:MAG: CsbD family protein [Gammaproteobacteria bacterium]|nr:CsbD family protein [Gammaproteobacteria bacterium]
MNKDQIQGRITQAKGKVKEVAGTAFSEDLKTKGTIQKARGKVQTAYGDLKEDLSDAAKEK